MILLGAVLVNMCLARSDHATTTYGGFPFLKVPRSLTVRATKIQSECKVGVCSMYSSSNMKYTIVANPAQALREMLCYFRVVPKGDIRSNCIHFRGSDHYKHTRFQYYLCTFIHYYMCV